tara:strand:- start:5314 stop:6264 length:951 start_codon:yes stop_codon:yes gene_type:complete
MIDTLMPLIKQFLPYAQEHMGFENPPRLFLRGDSDNASNPLGRTAHYNPQEKAITIYVTGRHPKDIMRSLSHELVHHKQNCGGKFDDVGEMGEGYAQNDAHLRGMEREAYEVGNMCFRDWEDSIKSTIYFEHLQKGENKMSIKDWKNNEISTLLAEAWGFKFNTLQEFNEFNGTGEIQEVSTGDPDIGEKESEGVATDPTEEENLPPANEGIEPAEEEEEEEITVTEDSGSEEGHHYDDNKMSDDEHIKAIEHHLDALRQDRDYDDDHIDERATNPEAKKPGRRYTQSDGQRVTAENKVLQRVLEQYLRNYTKKKR